MLKICSNCKKEKETDKNEFFRKRDARDGFTSDCKVCNTAKTKKWKIENLEKHKAQRIKYYQNSPKRRAYQAEWVRKNKDKVNATMRRYRKNNPSAAIAGRLRTRVYCALRQQNAGKKYASTVELLGCTIEELKAHIERQFKPGMTWELLMEGKIHLDHRIPCSSFDLTQPDQQRQCFHFSNLQPLWKDENLLKSDTVTTEDKNDFKEVFNRMVFG